MCIHCVLESQQVANPKQMGIAPRLEILATFWHQGTRLYYLRYLALVLMLTLGLTIPATASLAAAPPMDSLARYSNEARTQFQPPVPVVNATPARYRYRYMAASATPPADTVWAFNGEAIRFDGGSSYDQDEGGSWITAYHWQVNNGTIVTTTSAYIHVFSLPTGVTSSTYEIKLTITDDEGWVAVKRIMVVVTPDMGRLYYYADMTGSVRTVVTASGTVVETRDYDPWGVELEGRSLLASTQATTQGYAGYTKDGESGLSYAGQRYYLPEIGRMLSVDRFTAHYRDLTPYQYAGNDPVGNTDINGDSINVTNALRYDEENGTSGTEQIRSDWEEMTGLSLSINEKGMIVYAKDENGNPVVAQDSRGRNKGSSEARSRIVNMLKDSETAYVYINNRCSSQGQCSRAPRGGNRITLVDAQIDATMQGARGGLNPKSVGWGMTAFHEALHTKAGGSLADPKGEDAQSETGPVVDIENTVRREMGSSWGRRMTYGAIKYDDVSYRAFDLMSLIDIRAGRKDPMGMHVRSTFIPTSH